MDGVGQLLRLFEIGRMGRGELEHLVSELDEEERSVGRSLRDCETWARAASNVDNAEQMMKMAGRQTGHARGGHSLKRTVSVDMDSYEESKAILHDMAEESRAREELREAARARLSHFEKRDGLRYRPTGRTPLERYQAALLHARDPREPES